MGIGMLQNEEFALKLTSKNFVIGPYAGQQMRLSPMIEGAGGTTEVMNILLDCIRVKDLQGSPISVEKLHEAQKTQVDESTEVIQCGSASDQLRVGSGGFYLQHKSHSNKALSEYTPLAKEALSNWTSSDDWVVPTDLPAAVLEWFQGQKHILFANEPISNFQDVSTIFMRVLRLQEVPSAISRNLCVYLSKFSAIKNRASRRIPGHIKITGIAILTEESLNWPVGVANSASQTTARPMSGPPTRHLHYSYSVVQFE
ncbi:uncharacterized protein TRUGW13939_05555 [Talaromyces rugulosus]|uniref:Uncharacterized protein n=1 Tax=Talaromyces rugulosus TaxID=121627 RepID=A0A7H8R0M5_TALRU|nr:uncharacterized protein TRUGW13939_05555 [Talaromyces rugulosus]QKX58433.1 hypothetical protein TRUGW13939_05555 [Talaromyces rugulosus]